ncbi:MAG: hypothetical protein AAGA03_18130, partial [Planctomycetota bacterium]
MKHRTVHSVAMVLLSMSLAMIAGAQDPPAETSPPTITLSASSLTNDEAVSAALERIDSEDSLDDELKERLRKPLVTALNQWKQQIEDAKRYAAFEQILSTVNADTTRARLEVDAGAKEELELPDLRFKSLESLTRGRTQVDAQVDEARRTLQAINTDLTFQQTRRTEIPQLIVDAKQVLSDLQGRPVPEAVDDDNGLVTEARRAEQAAQLAATQQRIETLQRELAAIEGQTELLPLRKAIAERILNRLQKTQIAWADAVSKSKEARTRVELDAYRRELGSEEKIAQSLILQSEDEWMKMLAETDDLARSLTVEEDKTQELARLLRDKQETIRTDLASRGGIRSSLGLELQLLQNKLPSSRTLAIRFQEVGQQIDELQARQAGIEMRLESTRDNDILGFGETGFASRAPSETETKLAGRYVSDLNTYIDYLVRLQKELEQQQTTLLVLREVIDRHVMWIRNRAPFGWEDIQLVWPSISKILHPSTLIDVVVACCQGLWARLELLACLLVTIAALTFAGSPLRRRLQELSVQVRSRTSVSLRPTLSALLVTSALVLPLYALLYILGEAIESSRTENALSLAFG